MMYMGNVSADRLNFNCLVSSPRYTNVIVLGVEEPLVLCRMLH